MDEASSPPRTKTKLRDKEDVMSRSATWVRTIFATVVVSWTMTALVADAQSPAGAKPIPRASDGKPDFSGMWDNPKAPGGRGAATVFDKAQMAPFVPGG